MKATKKKLPTLKALIKAAHTLGLKGGYKNAMRIKKLKASKKKNTKKVVKKVVKKGTKKRAKK